MKEGSRVYRWGLVWSASAGLVGAVLAFALEDEDPVLFDAIRLEPFGLILLSASVLGAGAWWWARWRTARPRARRQNESTGRIDALRAIGGLVAVVVAILGVVTLAVTTLALSTDLDEASMTAIATSAFGVISAVAGAYLGIKISSEQNAGTQQAAGIAQAQAAVAQAPEGPEKDRLSAEVAKAAVEQAKPSA